MIDPFCIEGPAVISFSGGRTSGYMLRRILDAGLRPDCHILFANTGKERPETLAFVRECSERWKVQIHWLEYQRGEVDPSEASVNGEPFAALIQARSMLPNPMMRFCTSELKVRPIKLWMREKGYEHWLNVVGIRADEPRRVARMLAPNRERWDNVVPLYDARVTVQDVMSFWAAQPFDLRLKSHQGNCDLCFLKGRAKKMAIIRDDPSVADWWIEQERLLGKEFRNGGMNYAAMKDTVERTPLLFAPPLEDAPDDIADCGCHD